MWSTETTGGAYYIHFPNKCTEFSFKTVLNIIVKSNSNFYFGKYWFLFCCNGGQLRI